MLSSYDVAELKPNSLYGSSMRRKNEMNEHTRDNSSNMDNISVDRMEFSCSERWENILKAFPSESESLETYKRLLKWSEFVFYIYVSFKLLPLAASKYLEKNLDFLFKIFFGTTTTAVLASITKNKDLAGVLCWCWPDYGVPPGASCFMSTALLSNHFSTGAYYPEG